ncbi:DUF6443 domain-containing protein [uncultured Flavobacterium sp.]|uniref:DUF6443 domain-containing protein n=1 Tax=uncultured Flavobacterium sp. TaxID=165435 RepID=UPI00308167BF
MKKYIAIIILLFVGIWGVKAQTFSDDNFVYTASPKKKVQSASFNTLTKNDMSQSVTYFDGLGRPIQTAAINQGGTNIDIVTPVEYDGFGRQIKEYLPYPLTNSTTTYSRIATATSITNLNGVYNTAKYENTTNPFSEKRFEPSPLNRVLEQAAPGNDWALSNVKKNTIKLEYQTNITTDAVRLFKATTSWNIGTLLYDITFSDAGSYAENELYKTVTFDENSGVSPGEKSGSTVEFKNKQGQVVLKRTYDATVNHDTYYVYDIYGNLTYVIPPKADATINSAVLDGLCYQYKYDSQNRLVEKKLPGKQWEFIVYDRLDRPVATGPAFSPFKDDTTVGWMITKYDAFSRPIYTGWSSQAVSSAIRKSLQDTQNAATVLFETKDTSKTIDGIAAYYTNANAPTSFKLLTVNYYDNYVFPGAQTLPSTIEGQTVLANVKTMATGSWIRAVTTAASIAGETNTLFYDEYARLIQTYSVNYLTGSTITSTNLDFAGKTIYTITKHKRTSGSVEMVIREDFTYSPQDRLLTHTHQINGGAIQLMAANTYDNLGQLTSKNVGNTTASPLQKVDFNYNIRGWLTEINKTANLQQGTDAKDLFAFKVSYNAPQAAIAGVTALYNGNISETLWKTSSDNIDRGYGYTYDKLNRLKTSIYEKSGLTTSAYDENLTYDKNGNIVTLLRKGDIDPQTGTIIIDNLVYGPVTNSNQLAKVDDSSNNTSGFNDLNKTGDDYTYDGNGNMITDKNKNITDIKYNQLNLPKKITFGTSGTIEYFYNAAGQKIQKTVSETGKTAVVTDYLGGFQYKDNVLEFFPTAEGYVKNTLNVLSYVFQYKDHLGNVRVSYAKNPTTQLLEIIEENNYYPFGLKHKGYNDYTPNTNKYKYNGKELQDELGLNMYDYGMRNYDPALGRWMNIDPLAEQMRRHSPFNYGFDNPIRFVDPDGMAPNDVIDPPSKKKTAWQQSYNPKTGNTDIGKFALLKFEESLEGPAKFLNSINTYVKEKIEPSNADIGTTATSKNGGGENEKTTGNKKGGNIDADAFLTATPGGEKTGNKYKSGKDFVEALNDVFSGIDLGSKATESVEAAVEQNTNKKEAKETEYVRTAYDPKTQNQTWVRRDVYEAQKKEKK